MPNLKIIQWLSLKRYTWKNYDFSLIGVVLVLTIISTYIISRVTTNFSMGKQMFGVVLSIIVMLITSIIDYHTLCKFVIVFYIISTVMVIATKYSPIGTDLNTNSFRWLDLGLY